MLSLILKPLLKKSDRNLKNLEIPFDTEISLSMIESGCIFSSLNRKAVLIVKSNTEDIELLNNINGITINFELIERPEFPSLAVHLAINTVANKSFNFNYFFNTESPEEIRLLSMLKNQDSFDIILIDDEIEQIKQIQFGEQDKTELISLIDKVIK